jgi:hypothetical protein
MSFSSLDCVSTSRVLYQNPAHSFGGRGKKVASTYPRKALLIIHQPNIRLMD